MTDPIEIMARALWIHENSATISDAASVWDHPESVEHALYWTQRMADNHPAYRDRVRAANAALAEAGYAVVPTDPTEAMLTAAREARFTAYRDGKDHSTVPRWKAMIEAGRVKA